MWSLGMTSRPLCAPRVSWMPMPGPVATQSQSGFIVVALMLRGLDQVLPSSVLDVMNTALLSRLNGNQMVPVFASTTGHGLPMVIFASPPSSWTML